MCLSVVYNAYTIVMGSSQVRLRTAAAVVCHPPLLATRPHEVSGILPRLRRRFLDVRLVSLFSDGIWQNKPSTFANRASQSKGRHLRTSNPSKEKTNDSIHRTHR